ncbi:DinB family protein [Nocardioides mangrovicus]|uniref:DinB family protein n=1 Tax=Nocardioides mangrovicus TaxID=2478913 RepID=A0A3L8P6D5_9ACTN|nr:DinB family protein [Nocardioides mangrovicus]RLV50169.1 DinB family protein [Nocardioides mangrovicus]
MTESQREPAPRSDGGEVELALAFLDFARSSVVKKLDGLSESEARRVVLPTGTSLPRLVRHLTDGERYWFGVVLRGVGEEPDWEAARAASDAQPVADLVAGYEAAITASNDAVREAGDPAAVSAGRVDGETRTVRWILAHMTSETARHAGHADVVRELTDGVTGR